MSEKTVLNVEGMTCSNCALGISRFLEKQGLHEIRVDFTTGEVAFEEVALPQKEEVIKGINKLGYKVLMAEEGSETAKRPLITSLEIRFLICLLLTIPLMAHMFSGWWLLHSSWFQLALSTPVFIIGMFHFGKSATASLKTGIPNMDVLITIGSAAAYIYSIAGMILFGTANMDYLFFETSATIITLVLLGNIIEKRSVQQTTTALTELVALQPRLANLITITKDLKEHVEVVDISAVKKNDGILVNQGGVIPVDGKVYWGEATVDESALTGESVPAYRKNGDPVLAGSIVTDGTIKVVCEKTGQSTALSGIIDLIKEARLSKPEIQKLGDKVSAWFVPIVVAVSVITFTGAYFIFDISVKQSLMQAIAVLVISCPCAMGLATPTAVAAGLGRAAQDGILVKGGATLESFEKIKSIVFDKTGTLTTGAFRITEMATFHISMEEAINILYSIEQHSSHPIAKSIVKELSSKTTNWISFNEVHEIKGTGIEASDASGNKYLAGSYRSHELLTSDDSHTVYLSKNNVLVATVDMQDALKPGIKTVFDELHRQGIQTMLLSGDTAKRCTEVARELGIKKVFSEQLPADKARVIQQLKSEGRVIMIGDGINDAPSLTLADVGISFGDASKIAVNSAEVIFLNGGIDSLLKIIRTGKLTFQTIRQNLFWAFAYNIIAIPVAAAGFLSPMVAALSMAFSDVIVIGNSIRLKFRK